MTISEDDPHIYFDASRNQLVIADRNWGPGAPNVSRFDVPNGAALLISSTVKVLDGDRFSYTYVASDDINAPQRPQRIGILLPEHDGTLTTSGAWPSQRDVTSLPDNSATIPFGKMRIVSWVDPSPRPQPISRLPLQLGSSYRPGFSDAYVWGKVEKPLSEADIRRFSDATRKELEAYAESGYGRSRQMVIAPLFRADTPKKIIAANYHFSLQHLAGHGRLGKQSTFTQALLQSLTAFLASPAADGKFIMPSERPLTPLEIEVDNALRLAFR